MRKVLDACAVIAYASNERGADKVEKLVESGQAVISVVNVAEIYEYVYRRHGDDAAKDTLDWIYDKMDVRCAENIEVAQTAGELIGFLDVPLGDAFCAALAEHLKLPVLTKDKTDFKPIQEYGYCKVEFL